MDKQVEDKRLVKEFLDGNERAFKTIVDKYSRRIYWHAYGMLNDHFDADEVTQTVLLILYEKLSTFNFDSLLYTWIYKITTTRSLNYIRKKKLKSFFSIDSDNIKELHSNENIILNIETSEKLEKINDLLKTLPPKQREVFILKNFEGMTYKEISKITGKSVGGLKANYFHALKKIKEKQNEEK